MTADTPSGPRAPRAFKLDDPGLEAAPAPQYEAPPSEPPPAARRSHTRAEPSRPSTADMGEGNMGEGNVGGAAADAGGVRGMVGGARRGIRWGAILVSALSAAASLALAVWYARFVSVALERNDWVGWTVFGLLSLAGVAALVIVGRELIGLLRLSRLKDLRRDVDTALSARDAKAEARALKRLKSLFSGRPEMKWPLARLAEHEHDVRDPGELLSLADRELLAPLDIAGRRLILKSAKRVGTVTAMSPIAALTVGFVAIENLRLLRSLAGLYGGRPGGLGALRLARLVIGHIIATGGIALTDDLVGQFIGQDLLRRLSRRLGEGAFNGALTARVGAAAIEVCRPLPYIAAPPVRARDIAAELFKKAPQ